MSVGAPAGAPDDFPVLQERPSAPRRLSATPRRVQGRAESPCCARRHTPPCTHAQSAQKGKKATQCPPKGAVASGKPLLCPQVHPRPPRRRKKRPARALEGVPRGIEMHLALREKPCQTVLLMVQQPKRDCQEYMCLTTYVIGKRSPMFWCETDKQLNKTKHIEKNFANRGLT